MTEMEAKLKEAGIKVTPFPERIWNELHLHPHSSSKMLIKVFNSKPSRVYSTLNELLKKGLVQKHTKYDAKHRLQPSTYTALGLEYRPAGYPVINAVQLANLSKVQEPVAPTTQPKSSDLPAGMGKELLGYTVLELRAIRDFINGVLK